MKPFNGFDRNNVVKENEKLPAGGYIIGIIGAEVKESTGGNSFIELRFDIAEGEHKNFFSEQYKNSNLEDKKYKGTYRLYIPADDGSENDEFTKRRFNSAIFAIEDSNSGYHWDWNEKSLVGKKVGCIMFEKEWSMNGKRGFYTTVHSLKDSEKIRNGDFKIPEPKMLEKDSFNSRLPEMPAGSKPVLPGNLSDYTTALSDGDLPF